MNILKFLLYPLGFLVLSTGIVWAGQMTLTSYYPSPSGNYNKLTAIGLGIGTTSPTTGLVVMNGNVGIGTAAPNNLLNVNTPAQGIGAITVTSSASGGSLIIAPNVGTGYWNPITQAGDSAIIFSAASMSTNALDIAPWASATSGIRITGAGNVGIGTAAPIGKLDVEGGGIYTGGNLNTAGRGQTDWYNVNTGSIGAWTSIYSYGPICSGNAMGNCTGASGVVLGSVNTSAVVNIPNSGNSFFNGGNVGIGTASPTALLQVNNASGYYTQLANGGAGVVTNGWVESTNGGYTSYFGDSYWGVVTTGMGYFGWTTGVCALLAYSGYSLYAVGPIWSSSTITAGSDQRLKKDIRPITHALDKVQRLNGVTFTWKKSGAKDIGVIAQNVEKVLPEIVHTDKDGMKGIEYGNLAALLIEAIKEQQKEIKDQQKEIEKLEKNLGGNK